MSFCTDVVHHLATLNMSLQGKNKFKNNLVQDIFSFQNKLKLFQRDLRTNNLNHFPYLKKIEDYLVGIATKLNCEDYVQKLECLPTHFEDRFKNLKLLKPSIAFLENPFVINVIENGCPILKSISMDTATLEIELLELLEDEGLKQFKYSCHSLLEFWKHVPVIKYPKITLCAQKLISIFGTIYSCESLYSTMKMIKSKHRSTLTDDHLTELLRTALTT
ncbi:general transcription factor II-I repeat domain-containing protein 2-like [Sipha flava]|uniref:General transcription factor II-I repeat domain-containing protein 2-like n=1 Tax=Sipha flava TaxID=143950 RepID=A0A8B8FZZ6_9HEMI|nr:general transcription factor II-I repeat domain-containing protein 2-like [Sipha flava]